MSNYAMIFSVISDGKIYRSIDIVKYTSKEIPSCFQKNYVDPFGVHDKNNCYVRINNMIREGMFCSPNKLIKEINPSNPKLAEAIEAFVQYCKMMDYSPRIFCFPEKYFNLSPLRSF